MHVLRKAPAREVVTESPLEYVVSTADRDRHGDTIDVNGWDTKDFETNSIALFNHNPDFPIGTWVKTRVAGNELRSQLKLAPRGTSPRIDEVSTLINAGIIRSTSVGFIPLEQEPFGKGIRYKRQKLLEISMVSIPSNASATLIQAKRVEAAALGIPTSSINRIFTQSHNATGAERQATARRTLELSGITTYTPAERARIKANIARLDAENTARTNRLEHLCAMVEALREEAALSRPTSYSDFEDHDRYRRVQKQLTTWEALLHAELRRQGLD